MTKTTREEEVVLKLRQMILAGEFAPGEKLVEADLADKLGVSRIPIRYALSVLQHDGLVHSFPRRGSVVAQFTVTEIVQARELRGVLEGMAARIVAEQGLSRNLRRELEDCIAAGAEIAGQQKIGPDEMATYRDTNVRFHKRIVASAEHSALTRAYETNNLIPLADPGAFSIDQSNVGLMQENLHIIQREHSLIVDALIAGQGTRAEALMREHSLTAVGLAMTNKGLGHGLATPGTHLVVES